jgi:phosphoenolpyruvate-protein phosphotransferase (PTS system enzyme I)
MRRLRGIAASQGVALGPFVRVVARSAPAGGRIPANLIETEIDSLRSACRAAAAELLDLADGVRSSGRAEEAAILKAHAEIAVDRMLLASAERAVEARNDAVAAIRTAAASIAGEFQSLPNAQLAERAADVLDVAERIAARLANIDRRFALDDPAVVVAEDIPPSLAVALPPEKLLGIALESGSSTSHIAILARSLGIPAVVGIAGLLGALTPENARGAAPVHESAVAIDGDAGEIVIDPDASTTRKFETRRADAERTYHLAVADSTPGCFTSDGLPVQLLANIGSPMECAHGARLGAGGVGLFRTEYLFSDRLREPSEDEQVAAYLSTMRAFPAAPVTIRLLDIGGDKPTAYLHLESESNPFLGVRALRIARQRPDIFVRQLRAILRASAITNDNGAHVKIMAPMIADALDVNMFQQLVDQAKQDLARKGLSCGPAELGVMLEIPGAVLTASTFISEVDFVSIGTNDLLQYTLAADRGNPALRRYQDPLHPAHLRLIRAAVEAATQSGTEISVCGEMAGDPLGALALVGLGVHVLSMAPTSLAPVRRAILAVDSLSLRAMAEDMLGLADPVEARAQLRALLSATAK